MTHGGMASRTSQCNSGAMSALSEVNMPDGRGHAQYERELIGRNLIVARAAKQLSQDEVAAALGVNQAALSYWERGRRRPSAAYLTRLAALYERDYGWFFGDHPAPKPKRRTKTPSQRGPRA